jgi:FAD/FMN-containing dehydrogenase
MNAIEEIDPAQRIAVVQAGVTLQALHEAVEQHDLSFPLDLGARGSATIGGNAATNAGGNRVIRYGMTRAMVLGLEAVLADGSVISSLNRMIKNNAGYDLKQLFIGSEGTLGVITRLVLRLTERPRSQDVALVAIDSFSALTGFLKHMDRALGGTLSAFEVMWREFYQLVTTAPAASAPPLRHSHPYYVLVESLGADQTADSARFVTALEGASEAGLIADAAIAHSGRERGAIWALRDDVMQVMRFGRPITFDVSLPIATMEAYVAEVRAALNAQWPTHHCWVFGHLGDGNLHLVVRTDDGEAARAAVERIVYEPLAQIGGSVSAEHGVGLEKKRYLHLSRDPAEIALMRTLKHALDPNHILNPGKIF